MKGDLFNETFISNNGVHVSASVLENGLNIDDFSVEKSYKNNNFLLGLSLALLSSFFIGSSFILKKKGLLKLASTGQSNSGLRAGQGGHAYLKEWIWWSGFLTMAFGELFNFAAYGFVPATLVTPLGALSVLISAVMAAYFLNEKLNTIGKIGCLLTAVGSVMMVIHAPKEGEVKSVNELLFKIVDLEFLSFTISASISLIVLMVIIAPRYGSTNILVYILICSILGAFTVMSCKGLSLGIKEIIAQRPSTSYFYTFLFGAVAAACIVIQINYLNKSLDIFNTAIVTTVYYVLFTLCVMVASALLFKEFKNLSIEDVLGCFCGFTTIVCALCLIHFFKVDNNNNNNNSNSVSLNGLNLKVKSFDEKDLKIHNLDEVNNLSKINEQLNNNEKSWLDQNKNDEIFSSLAEENDGGATRVTNGQNEREFETTNNIQTTPILTSQSALQKQEISIHVKSFNENQLNENKEDEEDDEEEEDDTNNKSISNKKNLIGFLKGNYQNLQKKYLNKFNLYKRVSNENLYYENQCLKLNNKNKSQNLESCKEVNERNEETNLDEDRNSLLSSSSSLKFSSFNNFTNMNNNNNNKGRSLLFSNTVNNGDDYLSSEEEALNEKNNFLSQTTR